MSQSMHAIGIISIGEMGLGIGQLLLAHKYKVLTFAADRRYNVYGFTVFFLLLTLVLQRGYPGAGSIGRHPITPVYQSPGFGMRLPPFNRSTPRRLQDRGAHR